MLGDNKYVHGKRKGEEKKENEKERERMEQQIQQFRVEQVEVEVFWYGCKYTHMQPNAHLNVLTKVSLQPVAILKFTDGKVQIQIH